MKEMLKSGETICAVTNDGAVYWGVVVCERGGTGRLRDVVRLCGSLLHVMLARTNEQDRAAFASAEAMGRSLTLGTVCPDVVLNHGIVFFVCTPEAVSARRSATTPAPRTKRGSKRTVA